MYETERERERARLARDYIHSSTVFVGGGAGGGATLLLTGSCTTSSFLTCEGPGTEKVDDEALAPTDDDDDTLGAMESSKSLISLDRDDMIAALSIADASEFNG